MAQAQKEFSIVGKRMPRIDAYERVTGQAQYTGDIQLPGMLYARVLRSPHPSLNALQALKNWFNLQRFSPARDVPAPLANGLYLTVLAVARPGTAPP